MGGREQTPKFERQDRYIVLKRKDLTDQQIERLREFLKDIPEFKCVVVEEDWPISEEVWRLVENVWRKARGLPTIPAPLESEMVELIIAARVVAFEDQSYQTIKRLDKATEAFATRVPWDEAPESEAPQ